MPWPLLHFGYYGDAKLIISEFWLNIRASLNGPGWRWLGLSKPLQTCLIFIACFH